MTFRFDEGSNFEQNFESSVKSMEEHDPQMGALFRKHISLLKYAKDESTKRNALASFNNAIHQSIDQLDSHNVEKKK